MVKGKLQTRLSFSKKLKLPWFILSNPSVLQNWYYKALFNKYCVDLILQLITTSNNAWWCSKEYSPFPTSLVHKGINHFFQNLIVFFRVLTKLQVASYTLKKFKTFLWYSWLNWSYMFFIGRENWNSKLLEITSFFFCISPGQEIKRYLLYETW